MSGHQHDGLQCEIISMECDFRRKEAWLHLAAGNCCDMNGCIAFVTAIWTGFERIYTMSGKEPDTAYFRDGEDWKALAPAGPPDHYVVVE